MKIWDRHFMRHAGAESPQEMRRDQRDAKEAYYRGLTYEKPEGHPDRPSVMDREFRERAAQNVPESDNPSKILGELGTFKSGPREGEELTVVKEGPDVPSSILAAMGKMQAPPPPPPPLSPTDDPSAITRAMGDLKPPPEAPPPLPELDDPGAITKALREFSAPVDRAPSFGPLDMPRAPLSADETPGASAAPFSVAPSLDIPAEHRGGPRPGGSIMPSLDVPAELRGGPAPGGSVAPSLDIPAEHRAAPPPGGSVMPSLDAPADIRGGPPDRGSILPSMDLPAERRVMQETRGSVLPSFDLPVEFRGQQAAPAPSVPDLPAELRAVAPPPLMDLPGEVRPAPDPMFLAGLPAVNLPAEARGPVDHGEVSPLLDLPPDSRGGAAPEQTAGRVISGKA